MWPVDTNYRKKRYPGTGRWRLVKADNIRRGESCTVCVVHNAWQVPCQSCVAELTHLHVLCFRMQAFWQMPFALAARAFNHQLAAFSHRHARGLGGRVAHLGRGGCTHFRWEKHWGSTQRFWWSNTAPGHAPHLSSSFLVATMDSQDGCTRQHTGRLAQKKVYSLLELHCNLIIPGG